MPSMVQIIPASKQVGELSRRFGLSGEDTSRYAQEEIIPSRSIGRL